MQDGAAVRGRGPRPRWSSQKSGRGPRPPTTPAFNETNPRRAWRHVAGSVLSFTNRLSLGHGGQVHLLRVADQLHLARAMIHRQAVEVQVLIDRLVGVVGH